MRLGKFTADYSVIERDPVGFAAATANLVIVDARGMMHNRSIEYIAFSVDDSFDDLGLAESVPTYLLRMGINPDTTRTTRWIRQK